MRSRVSVLLAVVTLHLLVQDVQGQHRPGFKEHDENGRLVATVDADGRFWRFVYEPDGSRQVWIGARLSAVEKADGTVLAYAYDERGKRIQTRVTKPGRKPQYIDHGSTRQAATSEAARPQLGPVEHGKQITRPAGAIVADEDERGAAILRGILGDAPRLVGVSAGASTEARPAVYQPAAGATTIADVTRFGQGATSGTCPAAYRSFGLCASGSAQRATAAYTSTSAAPAATTAGSYTWDDNGNMTAAADGTRYTWDQENRLTRVAKTDGTTIDHTYDADGNRVETRVARPGQPLETTGYLIDPTGPVPQVVAETDGAGQLKAFYTRSPDGELLSVMRPDGSGGYSTRHVHTDAIGSVRRLTDEAGNITDGWSYTAFGDVAGRTGTDPLPYGFAGEAFDSASGLAYHRARWMEPRVGRFLSMDPFEGTARQPVTLHRYLYAGNDPVNRTDPTGRFFTLAGGLASINVMNTINAISLPVFQAAVGAATAPLLTRPATLEVRQLTGVIYAESRTREGGGDDPIEKTGVGTTFAARAFYAGICPRYNDSFGTGTIWSAIQTGSAAPGNRLWGQVMSGNDLRPLDQLQRNLDTSSKLDHYVLSVRAASETPFGGIIVGVPGLSNRIPVAFNQASNSPPSGRMERIGSAAAHTFYGFRAGRDCQ